MGMKKIKALVTLALTLTIGVACQKNVQPAVDGAEAASLVFEVAIPKVSLGTKANGMLAGAEGAAPIVSDPFGTDLSKWSEAEKLIDGRVINQLTLFLVDKVSGVLVGYRDIKIADNTDGSNRIADDGASAVVTFDYDKPVHSELESLKRGSYRVIVMANYAAATVAEADGTTKSFEALRDRAGNKLETYIESVVTQYRNQDVTKPLRFSRTEENSDSEYKDYLNLMNFALYSSDTQFLCPLEPMPLVLIKDFELKPGKNTVSGQLMRTRARLRIAVENLSNSELTVHGLKFGDNTTRDESFLFYVPGDEIGVTKMPSTLSKYGYPRVCSDVASSSKNALVAFDKETKISGLKNGSNTMVLFDGYILDGNGGGKSFSYDLDLGYDGKVATHWERAKKSDGSWDIIESDPDAIEDGGLYAIQNRQTSKRVLYAGEGQVETELLANDNQGNLSDKLLYFDPLQVFRFVRAKDESGNDMSEMITKWKSTDYAWQNGEQESFPIYYIQTFSKLHYVGTPQEIFSNGNNLKLVTSKDDAAGFVVRNDGWNQNDRNSRFLSFYSTKANSQNAKRDFINVNGDGSLQHLVNGWSEPDGGSCFYLHKVKETTVPAKYQGTITLSTIDPETAVASPVTVIHRNDFINILLTASYEEKSGELVFEVKEWNAGGGNIEFD